MSAVARTRHHNNRTIPMREDQLTPRHRLLVEYMLHGCAHRSLLERVTLTEPGLDPVTGKPAMVERHPEPGEPLDLIAAATILNMKRRQARSLSAQPAFQRLLDSETLAFRTGARARATRRMVALIDEPGQGKAADRKVQLQASAMTLGELGGPATSVTINNTVGVMTAGCVIDLREDDEIEAAATIEHEAA